MATLVELHQQHQFTTDKNTVHSYLPYYDELLGKFAGKPVNLLEIGIFVGGSILLWKNYFAPESTIIGMDVYLGGINEDYTRMDNVSIIYKDINSCNESFLKPLMFDVIVDDGSHYLAHQLHTFRTFKNRLNPGGVLIIEDIQPDSLQTFVELSKIEPKSKIVDLRHIKNREDDLLFVYTN